MCVEDLLASPCETTVLFEGSMWPEDIVKVADYIIDLGPGGGDSGGEVIAAGQPSEICSSPQSYTGEYLKSYLKANHSK